MLGIMNHQASDCALSVILSELSDQNVKGLMSADGVRAAPKSFQGGGERALLGGRALVVCDYAASGLFDSGVRG